MKLRFSTPPSPPTSSPYTLPKSLIIILGNIMLHLFTIACILQVCLGATTPCKRDACFNAVAANSANKPNLASRKADCSSIIKSIIDDDFTSIVNIPRTIVTTTVVVTISDSTTTISTSTTVQSVANNGRKRAAEVTAVAELDGALLEERDKVRVCASHMLYGPISCFS